jgi:hypothetical protein
MKKVNMLLLTAVCLLFCVSAGSVILQLHASSVKNSPDPDKDPANDEIIRITDFDFKGIKIVIEPELYEVIEKPVEVTDNSSASGKKCIEIKDGKGKPGGKKPGGGTYPSEFGKVVCTFSIPADRTYRLWGRRWWKDACGNTLTFQIKGDASVPIINSKEFNKAGQDHIFGNDASYNPDIGLAWKWTKGFDYSFKKGSYTIIIKNREDGVKLDQILLVEIKDPSGEDPYIPYGIEETKIPDPVK